MPYTHIRSYNKNTLQTPANLDQYSKSYWVIDVLPRHTRKDDK